MKSESNDNVVLQVINLSFNFIAWWIYKPVEEKVVEEILPVNSIAEVLVSPKVEHLSV